MAMGTKGMARADDIKHLYVPYLHETLTIETILGWSQANYPQYVEHYLPVYKETIKFPRQVSTLNLTVGFLACTTYLYSSVEAAPSRNIICRRLHCTHLKCIFPAQ